jgi:hypothetical protein
MAGCREKVIIAWRIDWHIVIFVDKLGVINPSVITKREAPTIHLGAFPVTGRTTVMTIPKFLDIPNGKRKRRGIPSERGIRG